MEAELLARFPAEERPAVALDRRAECRYLGQGYELSLPVDTAAADWRAELAGHMDAQHEREYGFAFPGDPVELINLRVTAVGTLDAEMPRTGPPPGEPGVIPGPPVPAGTSAVRFAVGGGRVEVPVLERSKLAVGSEVDGPAIVVEMDSTIVVNPRWRGVVLDDGAMRLTRKEVPA
jgi:N-methylhydantoinase A